MVLTALHNSDSDSHSQDGNTEREKSKTMSNTLEEILKHLG